MFLNNLGKKKSSRCFCHVNLEELCSFRFDTTNNEHESSKLTCKDFDKCDQIGI